MPDYVLRDRLMGVITGRRPRDHRFRDRSARSDRLPGQGARGRPRRRLRTRGTGHHRVRLRGGRLGRRVQDPRGACGHDPRHLYRAPGRRARRVNVLCLGGRVVGRRGGGADRRRVPGGRRSPTRSATCAAGPRSTRSSGPAATSAFDPLASSARVDRHGGSSVHRPPRGDRVERCRASTRAAPICRSPTHGREQGAEVAADKLAGVGLCAGAVQPAAAGPRDVPRWPALSGGADLRRPRRMGLRRLRGSDHAGDPGVARP